MAQENVSIAWDDFQNDMRVKLKQYIHQTDFSDITLVTNDNRKIPAHKLILSSGSTFFCGLFAGAPGHPHHLLYLRGVGPEVLEAVLQFLYTGQATISREMVMDFFSTAEDLGVEGLDKDIDKGNDIDDKTKYSVENIFSKSDKKGRTERKFNTILSNVDNLFKIVAWQKQEVLSEDQERSPSDDKTTAIENTLTSNLYCTLCNIYLMNNEDFQKHKEGHREKNEGPYKCDVCDSGFYENTRLKHHYNSHSDISPGEHINIPKRDPDGFFQCTVCKFRIKRVTNYRRHYQRIHKKASISCDECDFSTTDLTEGLKCHKRRKHSA